MSVVGSSCLGRGVSSDAPAGCATPGEQESRCLSKQDSGWPDIKQKRSLPSLPQPEFDPWDPDDGKRELIPESCPLVSTCRLWPASHLYPYNRYANVIKQESGKVTTWERVGTLQAGLGHAHQRLHTVSRRNSLSQQVEE